MRSPVSRAPLRVFLGNDHIADLEPKRPWDLRCRYTPTAVERWPANTPLLSCSLPLQRRPANANPFARGLLPEGAHLGEVARLARVPTSYTYDLLARYGRDVAGAFVVTSADDPGEKRWQCEPYTQDSLDDEVRNLTSPGLGIRDDSELSIAGLQNKLLLVALPDGGWGRPVHGQPSTHILKVDDPLHPGLVAAEHACLRLAGMVDVRCSSTELVELGDMACIIVKRYDRTIADNGTVRRLHQEDSCQALGADIDANQGRGKYERHGGPTYVAVAALLDRFAANPYDEKLALLDLAVFTSVIGNADGHGKNISVLHERDGTVALAPAYDCVPTMLWPKLRATSAMSVNGSFSLMPSQDDFVAEARRWGLPVAAARQRLVALAERLLSAAPQLAHENLAVAVTDRANRLLLGR